MCYIGMVWLCVVYVYKCVQVCVFMEARGEYRADQHPYLYSFDTGSLTEPGWRLVDVGPSDRPLSRPLWCCGTGAGTATPGAGIRLWSHAYTQLLFLKKL